MSNKTIITKDAAASKLRVVREFDAPPELVWKAWTEPEILDTWWAPKPWKAKTKSMEFREGGTWLYSMVGPEGEEHFSRADFTTIVPNRSYTGRDGFCDADGNLVTDPPGMDWHVVFLPSGDGTRVEVEITFASEADMQKIVEMGFEEGFTAAHGNLDDVLKTQVQQA
jgi:uncharacterized protein YndB with AHSA1/START domain